MAHTRNGDALVTLSTGNLVLVLAPHIGGSVVGFRQAGADLLRPTPQDALESGFVRRTSAFPLVPYCNRIAYRRFAFNGESYQLTRNGEEEHALHGNGWQLPWSIADVSASSCTLILEHRPFGRGSGDRDGWPFAFRAKQSFALAPQSLRLTLSVENQDLRPMPAGLGWHPFFPLRDDTILAFGAQGMWLNDAGHLPTEHVSLTRNRGFGEGRRIAGTDLNTCFTGWDRRGIIQLGGQLPNLRIAADCLLSMAIVYSPLGQSFFAFEPVSHMPDAINRTHSVADHGLRTLAPGETIAGDILVTVD